MADISRGFTFLPGVPGELAQFHQLVDDATILPTFITSKAVAAPSGAGDYFVFYQAGSGAIRRCNHTALVNSFPRGGAANQFALRKLGVGATDAAAGNDVRFPAAITGIRKANGAGPDTVAGAKDLSFAPVNLAAGTSIDWDAGDVFYSTLTANKVYTFTNARLGRVITVALKLQGHTVTWPALVGDIPQIDASKTIHYFSFIKTPLGTSATVVAV